MPFIAHLSQASRRLLAAAAPIAIRRTGRRRLQRLRKIRSRPGERQRECQHEDRLLQARAGE